MDVVNILYLLEFTIKLFRMAISIIKDTDKIVSIDNEIVSIDSYMASIDVEMNVIIFMLIEFANSVLYSFYYCNIFNHSNTNSQHIFKSQKIESLDFKLILESVPTLNKHKYISFKRSKRVGNLILKCMTPLKSKTKFIISVGFEMNIISTITHDFNENACCILNYEQIKFNKYVNENTGICEILLYTTLLS